jgi:hypothetical protein
MVRSDGVFNFVDTYRNETAARAYYDDLNNFHAAGAVGTYNAAVETKVESEKTHVNKDEMATRHEGCGGAAVGAVLASCSPVNHRHRTGGCGRRRGERPPLAAACPGPTSKSLGKGATGPVLAFLAACAFALGTVLQQKGTLHTTNESYDLRG